MGRTYPMSMHCANELEKFILNVKKRPALWDTRQPDNYNRPLVRLLWSEVEDELNFKPGTAARKFKSLKDTFRREYRKAPENSKWIYFKHMLFLKDVINSNNTAVTLKPGADTDENSRDQHEQDELDNEEAIIEIVPSNEELSFGNKRKQINDSTLKVSKRQKANNATTASVNLKTARTNVAVAVANDDDGDDGENDDDDFHFLMSCRKYLKEMPAQKKLQFRIKLQELIYKFLYADEKNPAATSCSSSHTNAFFENRSKRRDGFETTATSIDNETENDFNEFEDVKPDINELEFV